MYIRMCASLCRVSFAGYAHIHMHTYADTHTLFAKLSRTRYMNGMYAYTSTCMHTHAHTCIYTYIHTHTIQIYSLRGTTGISHVQSSMCIHTHTKAYIHTHHPGLFLEGHDWDFPRPKFPNNFNRRGGEKERNWGVLVKISELRS
jgi:hypothetical protein